MKINSFRLFAFALGLFFIAAACSKKTPVAPPPPPPPQPTATAPTTPPPAARPVVSEFSVEPTSIERGQAAQLRWTVTAATNTSIDNGIGTVPATGNRRITPTATTTYTLRATGAGGDTTA